MAPPASTTSLAPPSTGPSLRPRTAPDPKPGYVIQSPDSRISLHRPSYDSDLPSDSAPFIPNSNDLNENESDSDQSVVQITQAKDFLSVLKNKKQKP